MITFYRNTCPTLFKKIFLYKKWIDNEVWAILPDKAKNLKMNNDLKNIFNETIPFLNNKIFIHKNNLSINERLLKSFNIKYKTYSDDYFNQKLTKNSIIYCSELGNKEYVPLLHMFIYFENENEKYEYFIKKNKEYKKYDLDGIYYTRLHFKNEKTIGELYKNIVDYTYDFSDKTYKHIDNFKNINKYIRHSKIIIENEIHKITNSPMDRIADYSKIIYYLISKMEDKLTEEEKIIFSKIKIPDIDKISSIIEKDLIIQKLLSDIGNCKSDIEVYNYINNNITN